MLFCKSREDILLGSNNRQVARNVDKIDSKCKLAYKYAYALRIITQV